MQAGHQVSSSGGTAGIGDRITGSEFGAALPTDRTR